ncbi:hypothetical protein HRI_003322000 [Hibiscus trionum]|uniref:uracil phosphoribosyltransferase n=1 Tax=Hibiscus trionum TaxID=183268 RepID=A0A9W7MAI8_HIBTR|nr:hypothetical protein HRI_003322000 [Hibiscus trionum]
MASQVAPPSIIVGTHVWVEDPDEAWIEGEVTEVNGDDIKINSTSGKPIVAKSSNVYPKDPEFPSCGVDDMTKLAYLHEPGVLQNLKCRYDLNEIYTYTGNILIAVNPFRRLPHLYSNEMMEQYKGAASGELSPHPFAVADSSYRSMINEKISQSILVSGESGAGKTESTKSLMCYLAYMGGKASKTEERTVEQKVLESNPVLEAFGNAKTVRNNNSSRFGKFVEIQFDQKGQISGAAIRTYLLERSRVCQVSDPERNYHCFYMICAAPSEDVEKHKLGNPRTFHYLNQSNCYELDGVDEFKEYLATKSAMDVVGINQAEQDAIFRVVAAILHLGNIEFVTGKEADSSEPKDDKSRFHLETAAELFKCNVKALEDSLVKRVMVTRGESITKPLDPVTAALSRDALAKIVYSKLFDWLVDKINVSIGQDPGSKMLIGVLDIYGFESFKTNSFEQFCINLTNEKLQQHFNQHVFKMEQEEYKKEEIDWSYIEFIDNQDILDLIEKKPGGIIALLDEACMFPRSTNETFAQKLYQTFKDHKRFSKPKLSRTDFTIYHYAGEVTYQTDLFLDKNKDYVVSEHQALMHASECSFVSSLFPPPPEETSKSSKFSSIGSAFKQQLQSLLETLSATEPHYIRCVKPNNALKPAIFENKNVLQQLRCGGVMEAIRISCAGFPSRKTFREFSVRFSILAPELRSKIKSGNYDEVAASKMILEKSNLKGYQIGKTKVFLRAGQMAELDALRAEILGRSAIRIQRKVRTNLARKYHKLLRSSVIQIQALCRGVAARHKLEGMRREAERKARENLHSAAISIQTGIRGMVARSELRFKRQPKAATAVQDGRIKNERVSDNAKRAELPVTKDADTLKSEATGVKPQPTHSNGSVLPSHPLPASGSPPRRQTGFVTVNEDTEEKSISEDDRMLVFVPPHPLIKHWVTFMRNQHTPCPIFRNAMAELGRLLMYEASRDWLPTVTGEIQSPLAIASVEFVDPREPVVIVPILRAGLALAEHASSLLPSTKTYHLGVTRNEQTLLPTVYLNKLPDRFPAGSRVFLVDPMLATGGTIVAAINLLKERGIQNKQIKVISALAASPALQKLGEIFPGLRVYTGNIDPTVNENGFIVPGLGDAADRSYGT